MSIARPVGAPKSVNILTTAFHSSFRTDAAEEGYEPEIKDRTILVVAQRINNHNEADKCDYGQVRIWTGTHNELKRLQV